MTKKALEKLLKAKGGICLDIGCGASKQEGFVGMDKRKLPGVDIVHDWNVYPWPLPDESCLTAIASHVVEHVNPVDGNFIRWMDEVWRVMKDGGQFAISHPYGWSAGYVQDPTHCNPCNAGTWQYFCPGWPLYGIYRPKPWRLEAGFPMYQVNGNMEVLLRKVKIEA